MLVCLQNLQATEQKMLPCHGCHRHVLHSGFALLFIRHLCHLILFCTNPLEGTWNSSCFRGSLVFFCVMLGALFYLSHSKSKVIHFLWEGHSEAAVTACFSRQSPTGALIPVSPVTGIHSLSWTLMTYVLCQMLSSDSTGTRMTMTS